jgi:hypothetical protein
MIIIFIFFLLLSNCLFIRRDVSILYYRICLKITSVILLLSMVGVLVIILKQPSSWNLLSNSWHGALSSRSFSINKPPGYFLEFVTTCFEVYLSEYIIYYLVYYILILIFICLFRKIYKWFAVVLCRNINIYIPTWFSDILSEKINVKNIINSIFTIKFILVIALAWVLIFLGYIVCSVYNISIIPEFNFYFFFWNLYTIISFNIPYCYIYKKRIFSKEFLIILLLYVLPLIFLAKIAAFSIIPVFIWLLPLNICIPGKSVLPNYNNNFTINNESINANIIGKKSNYLSILRQPFVNSNSFKYLIQSRTHNSVSYTLNNNFKKIQGFVPYTLNVITINTNINIYYWEINNTTGKINLTKIKFPASFVRDSIVNNQKMDVFSKTYDKKQICSLSLITKYDISSLVINDKVSEISTISTSKSNNIINNANKNFIGSSKDKYIRNNFFNRLQQNKKDYLVDQFVKNNIDQNPRVCMMHLNLPLVNLLKGDTIPATGQPINPITTNNQFDDFKYINSLTCSPFDLKCLAYKLHSCVIANNNPFLILNDMLNPRDRHLIYHFTKNCSPNSQLYNVFFSRIRGSITTVEWDKVIYSRELQHMLQNSSTTNLGNFNQYGEARTGYILHRLLNFKIKQDQQGMLIHDISIARNEYSLLDANQILGDKTPSPFNLLLPTLNPTDNDNLDLDLDINKREFVCKYDIKCLSLKLAHVRNTWHLFTNKELSLKEMVHPNDKKIIFQYITTYHAASITSQSFVNDINNNGNVKWEFYILSMELRTLLSQ